MKNILGSLILILITVSCAEKASITAGVHGLSFSALADRWDEAIPLGNGYTGALVWEKEGKLRISLDRADLWDLRPMENIGIKEWSYSWVFDQWKNNNYSSVQEKFDAPYDRVAGPTKIPAAALEFDISGLGKIRAAELDINNAICKITWENGADLEIFIEAEGDYGWYRFSGKTLPEPLLLPPSYDDPEVTAPAEVITSSLDRLGYIQGKVVNHENGARYEQEIWGKNSYSVEVSWASSKNLVIGRWSVERSVNEGVAEEAENAGEVRITADDYFSAQRGHILWWTNFWRASSVSLPDTVLEKQWYLEMYKFGSVSRRGAPPVSLQAVWTADNGQLPPWKGDFHHDLNTQLSYWPAYSSNHTDLSSGFTDWLWNNRDTFKRYTSQYFGTGGLNVPGVSTLDGEPMGGWIQYSFGPTVSSWLAHHFYLQWRYTGDTIFLREQAYTWLKETALHLEQLSVKDDNGQRKLPISSSPEFNDNSREAWFPEMTNFDLALTRWTFEKAAELASALSLTAEEEHYLKILDEWPVLATDPETGLMIAPRYPYAESHRHFSHLMAIYPLRLIDAKNSYTDSLLIEKSLANLVKNGSDYWTGYSFAWLGNLYAAAGKGTEAAAALRTFAECFCLPNSFHVNGDQSGRGMSKFTYRPFTLEGNFAFAAGIQEMLLQSHRGMIEIFPAVPGTWENVSFNNLRAEGSVLVSAEMKNGKVEIIKLFSCDGGTITLCSPFRDSEFHADKAYITTNKGIQFNTVAGEEITIISSGK